MLQGEGRLPGIVEAEAWKHDRHPVEPDRTDSKVAHIGVERLGPRNTQEHASKHEETNDSAASEVVDGEKRIESFKHGRILEDTADAEYRDGRKPHRHDGAEGVTDACRPQRLDKKQSGENQDRQRDNSRLTPGYVRSYEVFRFLFLTRPDPIP